MPHSPIYVSSWRKNLFIYGLQSSVLFITYLLFPRALLSRSSSINCPTCLRLHQQTFTTSSHTTLHIAKISLLSGASDLGVKSTIVSHPGFATGLTQHHHHHHTGQHTNPSYTSDLPSTLVTVASGHVDHGRGLTTSTSTFAHPHPLASMGHSSSAYQAQAAQAFVTTLFTNVEKLWGHTKDWDGRENESRVKILQHIAHNQDLAFNFIGDLGHQVQKETTILHNVTIRSCVVYLRVSGEI